ncbi:hypothetical protein TWF281_003677 [Arthrobotrys megalospora]
MSGTDTTTDLATETTSSPIPEFTTTEAVGGTTTEIDGNISTTTSASLSDLTTDSSSTPVSTSDSLSTIAPTESSQLTLDTSTTTGESSVSTTTGTIDGEVPVSATGTTTTTESPTSTEIIPTYQTGPEKSLSGGAIAGIVIGVIILVALAIAGIYVIHRRKKRLLSHNGEESNFPGDPALGSAEPKRHDQDRDIGNSDAAPSQPVQFDAPLDDIGITKLFNQLDDRISNHLVNFNLQENMQSSHLTNYPDLEGPKATGEGILFRGKALLSRQDSRLYMLRALFAYHIFGAIADQIIFTREQRQWIRQVPRGNRATRRAAICRQLETESNFASVVDYLYNHLERETQIHVPPNMVTSENRQASLREIAKSAALVTLRLGLQRDSFKLGFLFDSSSYVEARGKIACETSAVKSFHADPESYEVLGEAGSDGVVGAMISPSVYRCSHGEQKYMVRRMKVFMAPRSLKQ